MSWRFEQQMGFSRAEFVRLLPRALHAHSYIIISETLIKLNNGVHIHLSTEQQRHIAGLCLPYLQVRFEFTPDWPSADAQAFLRQFAHYYQRGGG